uniref:Chromosome 9 open reading frame 85 n=1 Tax=Salvator merianae TaxID=96440 RepID=A0A8D0KGB2_SALMN
MSTQRGNIFRTRPQRHQNAQGFKNDKYDTSAQRKKINAKLHEGLCQHCKEILEWRVKFNKYKPLTQPKKCVKCLQKAVKDSYHIVCKACASENDLCAKCGKREEIVIPIKMNLEKTENELPSNDEKRSSWGECDEGNRLNLSKTEDEDLESLVKQLGSLRPEKTAVE